MTTLILVSNFLEAISSMAVDAYHRRATLPILIGSRAAPQSSYQCCW